MLRLGRFDRDEGWVPYGQLSVTAWLRWRTHLARSTAYEKVRVARALLDRDVLRTAFEEDRVSYSAVRAISRLDAPDAETDEVLVRLAEVGSVDDVEMAVRTYEAYANQELAPDERWARRGCRVGAPVGGLSRLDGAVTQTEGDELNVALDAFRDKLWRDAHPKEESPGRDSDPTGDARTADAPTAAVSTADGPPEEKDPSPGGDSWATAARMSRADALMAMVRTATAHLDDRDRTSPDDSVMVHYLHHATTGVVTRLDGSPVAPSLAGAVCCDSTKVDHTVGDGGEPLRLSRKTRQWSTAQRRAISIRDGGRCRFPGCDNRMTQIHHCRHWQDGGATDVDNGALLCPRHHAMHHGGFVIEGHPDGTLRFVRPDGTPIGVTRPRAGGRLPL